MAFLFTFSPPLFFCFSCLFFSFAGHLVDFILVGKFFGKAFRILGLDEREGRLTWVVKKDFHGNFWVNGFFAFFSALLD